MNSEDRSSLDLYSPSFLKELAKGLPHQLSGDNEDARRAGIALRLCLNLTNNNPPNCDAFAMDNVISSILGLVVEGFRGLHIDNAEDKRAEVLDTLLLALGLMINLAEHSDAVRKCCRTCSPTTLPSLVGVFAEGQERASQADSMEESRSNVAYGYLAIFLGNVCLDKGARTVVRSRLPDQDMSALVQAIREFVAYNQKVDSQSLDGEDGSQVWTTFTERMVAVAARIQET